MGRDAVQAHLGLGKSLLDFLGGGFDDIAALLDGAPHPRRARRVAAVAPAKSQVTVIYALLLLEATRQPGGGNGE